MPLEQASPSDSAEEPKASVSSLRSRFEQLAGEKKAVVLPGPGGLGKSGVSTSASESANPTPRASTSVLKSKLEGPISTSNDSAPSPRTAPQDVPPKIVSIPPTPIATKPTIAPSLPPPVTDFPKVEEEAPVSVKALRDRFSNGKVTTDSATPSIVAVDEAEVPVSTTPAVLSRNNSSSSIAVSSHSVLEVAPTTLLSSSPGAIDSDSILAKRRPAPPRPISRSNSPKPPEPNRASKPISSRPTPRSSPPGSGDSSPTITSSIPESSGTNAPILPARRPTISNGPKSSQPPPIPGNRPRAVSPIRKANSTEVFSEPPQLPQRSRAATVSRSEETRSETPPPLPTRQATVSQSILNSLPVSQTRSLPVSPHKDEVGGGLYHPPPPPTRNAASGISPHRHGSAETKAPPADLSSEDDEEEDPVPLSGLSASAKRALEEYPDATKANRRPPRFVPDIRMVQPHHIFAFAVFGRHVVTGAHHVRVYDTQLSDRPTYIIDLKETGLEFRIKDPKVTAMGFRPGSHPNDEGRFLWCGTKDGHLWELDIMTGQVTDTRACAHGASVLNIFRWKSQVLTLDEGGKLNVYDVPVSDKEDSGLSPTLTRTVRVSDRFTFARMIRGQLWTATAPTARSTTTAASKGATIRVYEPCAEGSSPPAKTLFTTEWTGAVTSATILPLHPDRVYLGHEGGFVSIWSSEDLSCIQVMKVSTSDILALEGIGERLWAGGRKGQIHVYDVSQKPWQTTNFWTAHSEHAISSIVLDPFSIEHTGRCAVWTTTRDSIGAWDGLLSVDWIDCQMTARQAEYCSFREVKTLVCSWNIDSAKPTDLAGTEENALFLDEVLTSVESPDIVVFGFQEVIPLTNKKLTAKTLLFGGKNKEAGAMSDKVSSAYRQWLDKLTTAVRMACGPEDQYVKVHSESLVGLFTCVFVKRDQKDALRDVDITTVKRGLGNIYGNKGAIVARMVVDDTSLCFINVHLAAGQSQKAARNADLNGIMEDKAILPASDGLPFVLGGNGTAILDHELVILNGDLNYRIDQRRENVISNIAAGELDYLLEHDQLRKEMRGNHAFRLRSFDEAPISFAPTYKYNRGSTEYDSSEKKRIPAWCDRILYTKSPNLMPINYQRYETTISDHRPISAAFRLKIKAVDKAKMARVRGDVGEDWVKREIDLLERMVQAHKELV